MSPAASDHHRRQEENVRLGRDLAERLAAGAAKIASTLEELAAVHESLSRVAGHPLAAEAAARAARERRIAARERAAAVWFCSIADGSYHPGSGPAN